MRWIDDDGTELGPDAVQRAIDREVAALADAGHGAGSQVPWLEPNSAAVLARYRACWRLGAVAVPLHARSGPADVAAVEEQLAAASLPDDAAVVLFTAGSTGAPRGVVHTHRALDHKATQMVGVHGLGPDDVVLMPAPLSHMSGLLNGLLVPGAADMTTVVMDRWDPDRALGLIEDRRVSFMVGPPTFFSSLWQATGFHPDRVASLRLVSCGGAGVSEAFVHEATARLGAVVKRTYGSTEVPTVATTPASYTRSPTADGVPWARTEGRAVPGTELRVVDPHSDPTSPRVLPEGTAGELWVRGPERCWGYLDATQTAAAITAEGWFRTGDLATLDDGWLTITGRCKDVIIRAGENIAAGEVEAALEAHPAVAVAVAVAEPDERLGERVVAVIVPVEHDGHRGAADAFDLGTCRRWFEHRGVARFKTPERVVCLEALPLLPTGKPDRAAIRALVVG